VFVASQAEAHRKHDFIPQQPSFSRRHVGIPLDDDLK
jgi:hypothetical protein